MKTKRGHTSKKPSVALISLGCPKNLVDSEGMARALEVEGFVPAGSVEGADILLINTCTFVKDATTESLEEIRKGARLKRQGAVARLIVAGCLAQRMGERLAVQIPEVDGLIGTRSWPKVADVCRLALGGGDRPARLEPEVEDGVYPMRRRSSFGHFGYLKITEGCHRCCSYCVIPTVRGPLRSHPPERLVEEARMLADGGVRELILVGEDTGAYGKDAHGEWNLPALLKELNRVNGLGWIRILYLHPGSLNAELLETAEQCEKVCAYLDVPVQHASDRILERMNRPTSRKSLERTLESVKLSPKKFGLRTTVMVGFPGETDEDFDELMDFVSTWEFDHLGAFCYSHEEGTPAAYYPDQVEEEVRLMRRSRVMELQAEISLRKNKACVGLHPLVLADSVSDNGTLTARTERQAPEIDGVTLVAGSDGRPGQFLTVRITDAGEYDLAAVPLTEGTR